MASLIAPNFRHEDVPFVGKFFGGLLQLDLNSSFFRLELFGCFVKKGTVRCLPKTGLREPDPKANQENFFVN